MIILRLLQIVEGRIKQRTEHSLNFHACPGNAMKNKTLQSLIDHTEYAR
jgi:hypothetical protein